jgi:FAD/FMN-containing dehydrogenase
MTITLPPVPPALRGKIVLPDDHRYRLLRSTYTVTARPAAVLLPENTEQVVAALAYARERGLPISVRSGGHGLSGRSSNNGGVVIDVSGMNRVELIDRKERLVRVPAGRRSRRRSRRTAWRSAPATTATSARAASPPAAASAGWSGSTG